VNRAAYYVCFCFESVSFCVIVDIAIYLENEYRPLKALGCEIIINLHFVLRYTLLVFFAQYTTLQVKKNNTKLFVHICTKY